MDCACGCGTELDFSKGRKRKKYIHGHRINVRNEGAEARKNVPSWNKGKERTFEEKQKISQNRKGITKGIPLTQAHKDAISKALKGRKLTEQWRGNMRKAQRRSFSGPKGSLHKKKISETLKQAYKDGRIRSSFYIDGRFKNNPNSNFNLYGGQFTQELKYKIRLRDRWICKICEKKRSTCVHHIDHNKLNNLETNLIILCGSCHAKYHKKSLDEQKLFKEKFEKYIEDMNNEK